MMVNRYSTPEFNYKTTIKSYYLSSTPDSVQGYGSLQLEPFIPLPNDKYPTRDLYVRDVFSMSAATQKLSIRVSTQDYPLKVTVVSIFY